MTPSPSPSPSSSSAPLTTLDYAAHVSSNSDIAIVLMVTAAALILLCLGILVARSIG